MLGYNWLQEKTHDFVPDNLSENQLLFSDEIPVYQLQFQA